MRRKYELWNTYKGKVELLMSSDDIAEIEMFKKQYIEDMDGKCELEVYDREEDIVL